MNGIATITISGTPVRLKFGLPAIKRIFLKMAGDEPLTDGDTYTYAGMANILFAGYLNSCMLEEKTPILSFEDFYNVIEEFAFDKAGEKEITDCIRAFEDSRAVKRAGDKMRPEEKKSPMTQSPLTGTK